MDTLTAIKAKLSDMKPQLVAKYHLNTIGLFGSIVRGDFTPNSDIDIVVDFSQPIGIEFVDMATELEAALNRKVDLVSRHGIKPAYYNAISNQIIYV